MKILLILFVLLVTIYALRLLYGAFEILFTSNKKVNLTHKIINTGWLMFELPVLIWGLIYIIKHYI